MNEKFKTGPRAKELMDKFDEVCEGYNTWEIIGALTNMMTKVLVTCATSEKAAKNTAKQLSDEVISQIDNNLHFFKEHHTRVN